MGNSTENTPFNCLSIPHRPGHGNGIGFVAANRQGELAGLSAHWSAPFAPPAGRSPAITWGICCTKTLTANFFQNVD